MREHEVPAHVQAEDKVLMWWFTFPQVVAVYAPAYGAYRYAPFGPSEVRLGLAVLLGVVAIVGKVDVSHGSPRPPSGAIKAEI